MRFRPAALLFVALVVLFAGSAQAAPFKYTDEAGDALDGRDSMDIISVSHDLRQVNKTGPPSLVFELELAAPPESQLASYFVRSEMECGSFYASYRPGSIVFGEALGIAGGDFYSACDDGVIIPAQFRVDGKTLRWTVALDGLPKALKSGTTLSALNAFSQIAEPATGIIGTGWADGTELPLPMDSASTDKTWTYKGI